MDNLNLIDSIFRRICRVVNTTGLVIKELQNGWISFCIANENDNYVFGSHEWVWENKEEFLLGNCYDMSLFKFVADEYIPHYTHVNHKRYTSFIDLCKTLKSCECIEELAIKLDLMGI